MRISDKKIIFDFEIGKITAAFWGYPPELSIEEIKNEFISTKNSI